MELLGREVYVEEGSSTQYFLEGFAFDTCYWQVFEYY